MIRSAIVDDERGSRETLSALLARHCPNVDVVTMADSVQTAAAAIRGYHPDLVFLDIQMPNGTAFDLLEEVREVKYDVIFITAYDQYAIRAIRSCALDYLLKPIDVEELVAAVQRAERELADRRGSRLDALLQTVAGRNHAPTRIMLPTLDDLIFMQIENIIRCEATGNYTVFHLLQGDRQIVSRTLKEYEMLLEESNFFRVHHTHLVNLNHVKKYIRGEGGIVVMQDGSEVPVARRRKDELLLRLSRL